ncbi:MAG TPA: glycoside hydrolase family 2 TIM barrel-domain containing protein [Bryobacteraceae bacterium]|nr:glycoside hydrolase family 2 TIM barrel-domain containing protein [Bryobacteraceae bacterium]
MAGARGLLPTAQAAPVTLPANESLTWGKEPIEAVTSRRAKICLNGIWQAMPAVNDARQQPSADWGYIRVPGGWQDSGNRMPGMVAAGSGGPWEGFNGNQVSRMWYQRPINVRADWAGRAVLLEFGRLSTDARVFVNDQECGEVHWPEGVVDITRAVTPGKEATVRVLVVATPDASSVGPFLAGNEPVPAAETQAAPGAAAGRGAARGLASRGLIGDVLLFSRPAGPHIDSIYMRPSTRQKQLALEVQLAGVAQSGNVHFTAVALDEKGREERRFEMDMPVHAAETQIVLPSWSWPNPRLWDIGQPNLYTLALKVQGSGLDDEMKQTFGFREFWIDGRKYFLNGQELRIRPVMGHPQARAVAEERDGHIDAFRWAGYNFQEIWPNGISNRGQPDDYLMWYERADLKGWPIVCVLEDIQSYAATWSDPETRERFRAAAAAQVKRYRNHPSIIMWNTSPNYGRGDKSPRIIGNLAAAWNKLGAWTDSRFPKLQEAIEILRSLDGTRPIMSHDGGPVGDVYTLNFYMDLIPLQEREEWLSYWAAYGDAPFYVVEFGAPLQPTYHRGRNGFHSSINTEPLDAEFCAIYFGNQAYAEETPQYRSLIRSTFQGGQTYASWQNYPAEVYAANFQGVQELFMRNTWRSWRTMGNTGGMFPWENAHGWAAGADAGKQVDLGPFVPGRRGYYFPTASISNLRWVAPQAARMMPAGKALVENNQPTLAWICGPGGRPNPGVPGPDQAFTAKDHNFWTGRAIEKQIALLNDTRSAQEYSVQWEATVAGRRVGSGEKRGTTDLAQTLFVPIAFNAPEHINGAKVDGQITMSAKIGQATHEDRFAFRVFAPPASVTSTVAVYDPADQTTALLRRLGCTVRQWDQVTAEPLIVIGRSALIARPDLMREIEPLVQNGARVIVFAQDPEFIRNRLGLRVAWHMSRRIFPVSANHAVMTGLDATDLSDWAGSSTLLEPYPNGTWEKPFGFNYEPPMALYGWRWGGRGAVCSGSVEKPHKGSWRPILEGEFDLAYSPLMELDYGKGRLIWCTLDLEDHAAKDPGALQLAGQIVRYAQTSPLTPKARKTLYIGDDAGAKLLDELGLLYERASSIPADAEVVVVGSGSGPSDGSLSAFVQGGGKVLVLPRSGESLPMGGAQKKVDSFHGSLNVPDWPEARGLSASDLRWRTDTEAWLIASGGDVGANGLLARKALGKGMLMYCQLDPNRFDADNKTYFRFTRWRQTRALCQVLANLGALFATDKLIFTIIPASAATQPWVFEPVKQPSDFYSSDYRDDYIAGDDPYRYYNW